MLYDRYNTSTVGYNPLDYEVENNDLKRRKNEIDIFKFPKSSNRQQSLDFIHDSIYGKLPKDTKDSFLPSINVAPGYY
jgi:hypothetical protein